MKTKQYELIICSVNPEYSEKVVKTAKELGVLNATSIKGRGTGSYETESFLGMEIQPEKEIIFLVVPKQHRRKVMQSIAETAGIYTESHGLVFSLPIEDWTGSLSKIAIPKPAPELKIEEIQTKNEEQNAEEQVQLEKETKKENNETATAEQPKKLKEISEKEAKAKESKEKIQKEVNNKEPAKEKTEGKTAKEVKNKLDKDDNKKTKKEEK